MSVANIVNIHGQYPYLSGKNAAAMLNGTVRRCASADKIMKVRGKNLRKREKNAARTAEKL